MRVANVSKFVQHVGPVQIEPGTHEHVPDDHDTELVRRVAARGHLEIARDELGEKIVERAVQEDVLTPSDVAARAEMFDVEDYVPEGWADMKTNTAKAWIRRCSDVEQLAVLLKVEDRPKVAEALHEKIAKLEATR